MTKQTRITLKNIKHFAPMSQETECFTATVYFDGKKAGEAENQGHGGCTDVHAFGDAEKAVYNAMQEYCKTLPPIETSFKNDDGSMFTYEATDEAIVDELIADYLQDKLIKADLRKRVMYVHDNGTIRGTKNITAKKRDMYLGEMLPQLLKDWGIRKDQILNLMPVDKAVEILRAQ